MPTTIGEILKNQRLDQKLSLNDIAGSTHIRFKYLEALENNDFDLLPSAVQGRGFLRAYAEFLELDPDPLLKGWEQKTIVSEKADQPDILSDVPVNIETKELDKVELLPLPQVVSNENDQLQDEIPQVTPITPSLTPVGQQVEINKSTLRFKEIGKTLRNQREILGLSLGDIEQYTHIRQFYLQSIEDGNFQELPSPVQSKGMIENYAQFLDINSDELLLDYAEGLQAQREEKLAVNNPPSHGKILVKKPSKQTLANKLLTPDLLIGSIVIFFLVVFAIWTTSRVISSRNLESEATIPGISAVLAATVSPSTDNLFLTEELSETGLETSLPLIESTPAFETTPNNMTTSDEEISSGIATDIVTEALSGTLEPDGTSVTVFDENVPLQLNVVITQRTYLKVISDGKTVFEGRTQPGNAYPFSGTESIELISGNAEALQIIFNEKDMGTIGTFGEVVDLIFTEGAVVTPTPKFTATPTGTTLPTMTLQPTATPITPTVTPYIP